MTKLNELPDPEFVLRAAEEAEPQRLLDDYTPAIHALRKKNYTFREIAEWLGQFGFEVDHNAVWRAYAKTLSDSEAHEEAEADENLEMEEARAEAERNGTLVTSSSTPAQVAPEAAATQAKPMSQKAARKKRKK